MIERVCSEAITRANRRIYAALSNILSPAHRLSLDALLKPRTDKTITTMAWLRQTPAASTARHILTHIDRLKALRALGLADEVESAVHRNRLLKIACPGYTGIALDSEMTWACDLDLVSLDEAECFHKRRQPER